eukprot:CAMPEP_0115755152 /NCGR_PEP_ID=MMETSP0272-20121206/97247_1 /TAXON_ID=71861 /ORGANISM="Scrippsiella trochoidea, Strain CCMP3099" /LENGTH=126 /DNA_ID=CAMNT_0003200599 /DNA_START=51 /DNA_END=427 /DNA_ORIENTATION=+
MTDDRQAEGKSGAVRAAAGWPQGVGPSMKKMRRSKDAALVPGHVARELHVSRGMQGVRCLVAEIAVWAVLHLILVPKGAEVLDFAAAAAEIHFGSHPGVNLILQRVPHGQRLRRHRRPHGVPELLT